MQNVKMDIIIFFDVFTRLKKTKGGGGINN